MMPSFFSYPAQTNPSVSQALQGVPMAYGMTDSHGGRIEDVSFGGRPMPTSVGGFSLDALETLIASEYPMPPSHVHGESPRPLPSDVPENHPAVEEHSQAFLQSVLHQIFTIVRTRVSQPQFEAWIRPLVLRHMTETSLVFGTESAFHKNWIWKNYRSILTEATEAVMGSGIQVHLHVLHESEPPSNMLPEGSSQTSSFQAQVSTSQGGLPTHAPFTSEPSSVAHGQEGLYRSEASVGFTLPELDLSFAAGAGGLSSFSKETTGGRLASQTPLLSSLEALSSHLQQAGSSGKDSFLRGQPFTKSAAASMSSQRTHSLQDVAKKRGAKKSSSQVMPSPSKAPQTTQISLGFPMGHFGQADVVNPSTQFAMSSGASSQAAQSQGPYLWTPRMVQSNLNPRYTFDNFVVGQHARFCYAAAMAVAEKPAAHYNPFFVYGGVGLGKTHLIQAIGHSVLQRYPDLVVRYVTAEVFTNELIARLSKKEDMRPFRDRYRNCDILIVDDVQFLEGKDRTQTEIFHTFNALYESGKQIILSSDRPPQALSILEERLRNRFEKGLIADIQPPDVETRIAILQNRLSKEHPQIPPLTLDILHYVADLYPKNIRELEGALTKIAAYFLLTQTPLELSTVQRILGVNNKAVLTLDTILEVVSQYFHLTPKDIVGSSRQKDIAHARHMAIFMMRDITQMSFPKIGSFLSHRKHTTILYAYEKMKADVVKHPHLKRQMQEILQRLNQS
ncbi:MAG: chromosomal replication initiator protein DnaA [Vampirovibrionales bacterium]